MSGRGGLKMRRNNAQETARAPAKPKVTQARAPQLQTQQRAEARRTRAPAERESRPSSTSARSSAGDEYLTRLEPTTAKRKASGELRTAPAKRPAHQSSPLASSSSSSSSGGSGSGSSSGALLRRPSRASTDSESRSPNTVSPESVYVDYVDVPASHKPAAAGDPMDLVEHNVSPLSTSERLSDSLRRSTTDAATMTDELPAAPLAEAATMTDDPLAAPAAEAATMTEGPPATVEAATITETRAASPLPMAADLVARELLQDAINDARVKHFALVEIMQENKNMEEELKRTHEELLTAQSHIRELCLLNRILREEAEWARTAQPPPPERLPPTPYLRGGGLFLPRDAVPPAVPNKENARPSARALRPLFTASEEDLAVNAVREDAAQGPAGADERARPARPEMVDREVQVDETEVNARQRLERLTQQNRALRFYVEVLNQQMEQMRGEHQEELAARPAATGDAVALARTEEALAAERRENEAIRLQLTTVQNGMQSVVSNILEQLEEYRGRCETLTQQNVELRERLETSSQP